MIKPMIRAQVRIHHDEDPALYTILSPLKGIARTRRIRQLVRAGVLAENGSGVSSSPRQAEKSGVMFTDPAVLAQSHSSEGAEVAGYSSDNTSPREGVAQHARVSAELFKQLNITKLSQ